MWKYMTVLVKPPKSHREVTHRAVEPTTAKNCRKTDHLQVQGFRGRSERGHRAEIRGGYAPHEAEVLGALGDAEAVARVGVGQVAEGAEGGHGEVAAVAVLLLLWARGEKQRTTNQSRS